MSPRRDSPSEEEKFDDRWRPALMSFFVRRVSNHAEAEDLTQEVLLRVLKHEDIMERPDGYIFQVAQNLLVDRARRDHVRQLHRQRIMTDKARDHDTLDPARIAEGRDQIAALLRGLEKLPERTRTIFILYRLENMTQEAIGQTFGISASAVKQHVAKAMAMLAKTVERS